MGDAAMLATTDIGGALQLLNGMHYADAMFQRGVRFVTLAHLQEVKLGYRSDNVETFLRWGFRTLARWSTGKGIH